MHFARRGKCCGWRHDRKSERGAVARNASRSVRTCIPPLGLMFCKSTVEMTPKKKSERPVTGRSLRIAVFSAARWGEPLN
jgi:hypothetical protein